MLLATKSSMGRTLLSLLSGFERQEFCRLYPSLPDVDRCNACYWMMDKDLLRSLCPGGEVERKQPDCILTVPGAAMLTDTSPCSAICVAGFIL